MKTNEDLSVLIQLGKRIAYLRKERKKSQLSFALEAGISKTYLCDLERGRRNPTLLVLEKIALALNITLEELFKGVVSLELLLK